MREKRKVKSTHSPTADWVKVEWSCWITWDKHLSTCSRAKLELQIRIKITYSYEWLTFLLTLAVAKIFLRFLNRFTSEKRFIQTWVLLNHLQLRYLFNAANEKEFSLQTLNLRNKFNFKADDTYFQSIDNSFPCNKRHKSVKMHVLKRFQKAKFWH